MQKDTKDIIIKFVELLDKKNLNYKMVQNDCSKKENVNENSK